MTKKPATIAAIQAKIDGLAEQGVAITARVKTDATRIVRLQQRIDRIDQCTARDVDDTRRAELIAEREERSQELQFLTTRMQRLAAAG